MAQAVTLRLLQISKALGEAPAEVTARHKSRWRGIAAVSAAASRGIWHKLANVHGRAPLPLVHLQRIERKGSAVLACGPGAAG